ncbi:hypothetical protein K1719_021133 [Acacia pycnantha]|nr:hypothetical protein K1719_021133 [Acacia pycnantha]
MQTPQSTLINRNTDDGKLSVLSDITNERTESNSNHTNSSALTEISRGQKATSVNPSSFSVNQHKLKKRSLTNVCQVATDLSHRFEEPLSSDARDDENVRGQDQSTFNQSFQSSYLDDGDDSHECSSCGAQMWAAESIKSVKKNLNPQFGMCCCNGKGRRALFFCPFRAKSPSYRELIAPTGNRPVYTQMYIYDTDNEVLNRISSVSRHVNAENLDPTIVEILKECLDKHNSIVKNYRKDGDIIKDNVVPDISIRLIRNSNSSMLSRQYNMPTTSELGALIVGDFDKSYTKRDIIVKRQSGSLQRIDELHMTYLPLQYPLLFPYGDNGYDSTNEHSNESLSTTKKKKKLTPSEYLAFRLMSRKSERSLILQGQKLLQQFVVDGYSMVESDRLDYIRKHQKELRVDLYSGLSNAVARGETDPSSTGRRVILPFSFTGGACYMIQNYQDAMAICSWAGYPDFFIAFTCNPMWPEITRHCNKDGLKPCDRPKILSRIFHIKLRKFMRILKDENIFGSIKADVYTIEFQKRGLPHVHIILWMSDSVKIKTATQVDSLISAEIPDKDLDRELYELVGSYMVHGPCGRASNNAPCMKDGKCSKYFPKKYNACTTLDENGYPTYRRRNDRRTVSRKGVHLDNRFVVPYNARLLKLFCAHLNIEKTNQSRAVKYLFKYISKGNDRIIAVIYSNNNNPGSQQTFDEISHYLNCRYVSSCEASWRIFGFDIHHRQPPVERLSFHLHEQQAVYFSQK